jgi:hypothetical protein
MRATVFTTLLLAACAAVAEQPASDQVSDLIKKLGSDEFEARTAAQKKLQEIGPAAVEALKKAAESKDAEIQQRATSVLIAMEQATVDKPATLIDALAGGPAQSCANVLRTQKELDNFIDTCSNDGVKKQLSDAKVDFGKEMLIAIGAGDIWYHPVKISVTVEKQKWIVHYTLEQLFGDHRKDISHPFTIIRLPTTTKGIEFDKTLDKCSG